MDDESDLAQARCPWSSFRTLRESQVFNDNLQPSFLIDSKISTWQ